MRVLVIEDDPMIGRSLDHALTNAGMAVDWVTKGQDGLSAIRAGSYGLVLLDLGLPDESGLDVLKAMRDRADPTPVVIISARDDLESRIAGLDIGADDYLVKPFDFKELQARIRAVVRRHQGRASSAMTVGELTLDIGNHSVTYRGICEVLPAKEFALLHALAERPGTILSRRQLEDRLYDWGNEVESNAVDVLIHYVRRKFDKEIVRNVRGIGWMIPEDFAMTSIRGRLLAWLMGLLTVAGLLGGGAAYLLDREEVDGSLDGQLRQIALNTGETGAPKSGTGDGVTTDPEDAFVVTIWDKSGRARSSDPTVVLPRLATTGFADIQGSGRDWRAYALVGSDRTVEVAQRAVVREEFAAEFAMRAVLPILVLIPLSLLLVQQVVGRVLRPVHRVTDELRRRDHASAGDPLPSADVPDEILPLVLAMNDLIVRLHKQLEFRQQFISDAAHELRTPLAALRLQVGNLRTAASGPAATTLIDEMERGLRRMSEMIAQMLDLARAEDPPAGRALSPINLRDAIAASLEDVIQLATEKGIDVGLDSSIAPNVMGHFDEVRILLKNLLDNAVRHTPPGGRIDLDLDRIDGGIRLAIRDTGPGVPDPLLGRLFDRFFRGEGAGIEGSGLGLAIVKAIAERCGATIALANRKDRSGLVARVTFVEAREAESRSPPAGPRAGRLRAALGVGSLPRDTTKSTEPELAEN